MMPMLDQHQQCEREKVFRPLHFGWRITPELENIRGQDHPQPNEKWTRADEEGQEPSLVLPSGRLREVDARGHELPPHGLCMEMCEFVPPIDSRPLLHASEFMPRLHHQK